MSDDVIIRHNDTRLSDMFMYSVTFVTSHLSLSAMTFIFVPIPQCTELKLYTVSSTTTVNKLIHIYDKPQDEQDN